ncbi:MAG: M2 family metallopeptidase [Thermoguttaceae bacterium]
MNRKLFFHALLVMGSFFILDTTVEAQALRRQSPLRQTTQYAQNQSAKTREQLQNFMKDYQATLSKLASDSSLATWTAYAEGGDEAFADAAEKSLKFAQFHSDPQKLAELKELRKKINAMIVTPIEIRECEKAILAFEQNQLPDDMLEKLTKESSEIEQVFQTFRGEIDGKKYSNNELLEMLQKETDSAKREQIWNALKQVGEQVAPRIVELAKIRNEAAQKLGYKNFWEMNVHFQEFKPEELLAIFEELDETTREPFANMKGEMDSELKEKFGVDKIMPWHYDNPFFQQAPPSKDVDPNDFYKDKTKDDIINYSVKYFDKIGLPVEKILEKSDLFEREGKSQHAFCFDIDASGDVRILCNIKPTDEWMDTQLHELGHAVYSFYNDMSLPFNLRDSAHIFTTEGVAMYFGAKARTPKWMIEFAEVDPLKANESAEALKKQRRKEQLIFARWTLVMLMFEKAMYENPDADLNKLWWDTVEKYQMMPRPESRDKADWASKPHFVNAPVYYHNYQLGELFAAQLRKSLGTLNDSTGPELGKKLKENVFKPGASLRWDDFVKRATGEPLSVKALADELR